MKHTEISDAAIAELAEQAHDAGDVATMERCEIALGAGAGLRATDTERAAARRALAELRSGRIGVGDWVVAGRGDETDVGEIVSLTCGRGTIAEGEAVGGIVRWDGSLTRTWCPVGADNELRVYGRREDALEERDRRLARAEVAS